MHPPLRMFTFHSGEWAVFEPQIGTCGKAVVFQSQSVDLLSQDKFTALPHIDPHLPPCTVYEWVGVVPVFFMSNQSLIITFIMNYLSYINLEVYVQR